MYEEFASDLLEELDNARQIPFLDISSCSSSQSVKMITGTTTGLLRLNTAIVGAIANDGGYAGVLLPDERQVTIYVDKCDSLVEWQMTYSHNLARPSFSSSSGWDRQTIPLKSSTLEKLQILQEVLRLSSFDEVINWSLHTSLQVPVVVSKKLVKRPKITVLS